MAVNTISTMKPVLHLTMKIRKIGNYYEAYCPELDVAAYGTQKNAAREELYKTARAVSSFLIATAPDGSEVFDRELQYAQLLEQYQGTLQELFKEGRNGTKSYGPRHR